MKKDEVNNNRSFIPITDIIYLLDKIVHTDILAKINQ